MYGLLIGASVDDLEPPVTGNHKVIVTGAMCDRAHVIHFCIVRLMLV